MHISEALLALALLGFPASPLPESPQRTVAAADDDLAAPFALLRVGMNLNTVLALMKREPLRQSVGTHLGLEIQHLVWTQFFTGRSYQVVLVAGHLVSKSTAVKPLIG